MPQEPKFQHARTLRRTATGEQACCLIQEIAAFEIICSEQQIDRLAEISDQADFVAELIIILIALGVEKISWRRIEVGSDAFRTLLPASDRNQTPIAELGIYFSGNGISIISDRRRDVAKDRIERIALVRTVAQRWRSEAQYTDKITTSP